MIARQVPDDVPLSVAMGCLFWGLVGGAALMWNFTNDAVHAAKVERYQLLHATGGWVYRIDRETGQVFVTAAGRKWREVASPDSVEIEAHIEIQTNGVRSLVIKSDEAQLQIEYDQETDPVELEVLAMTHGVGARSNAAPVVRWLPTVDHRK